MGSDSLATSGQRAEMTSETNVGKQRAENRGCHGGGKTATRGLDQLKGLVEGET
jgi:hypothetical protein